MVTVPNVNGNDTGLRLSEMSKKQRRSLLGPTEGSSFDAYTRMFASFGGGSVFETGEWKARDMDLMLTRDGDSMMIEQALTLPMRSATYQLAGAAGDTGELELVQEQLYTAPESGGLDPDMSTIIGQMSGARIYKKAFFEKKWDLSEDNIVKLSKLEWRPPSTCDIRRDEHTAEFDGFEQRAWWFISGEKGKIQQRKKNDSDSRPGFVHITRPRSFVFINGTHRNPLVGTSDMEVSYWCYSQAQKILFLWFQFLEQQSLPKVAAYGSDQDQADDIAEAISDMKSSAVAGFQRPPAGAKLFDVIASSGSGAQQFQDALTYLGSCKSKSILAGFLELGSAATLGRGSYALSESQSQFFLQASQGVVNEALASFNRQVVAPIVVLNRGTDAKLPKLTASPLTEANSQQVISLLTSLAVAPAPHTVPDAYVDLLAQKAATIVDLPADKVADVIAGAAAFREKEAAAQGAGPAMQGAAKIAGATTAASRLATRSGGGRAGPDNISGNNAGV